MPTSRIPLKKFNSAYWDQIRMKPSMTSISGKSSRLDLPVDPLSGLTDSAGSTGPGKLGKLAGKNSFTASKAGQLAGDMLPYVSNVINSFRKPPRVKLPELITKTAPVRVNFDNQRNEVDRKVAGLNSNFDKTLDENTGAALKMGTLAAGLREKNSISAAEVNTNAGLATDSNRLNLQVDAMNSGLMTKYNDDVIGRELADTRFKQQNLADVADKYMAQQGQRDAAELDMNKLNVMKTVWENSGVYDRLMKKLNKTDGDPLGVKNFVGAMGGRMKAFGGDLDGDLKVAVTEEDRVKASKDSFGRSLFGDRAPELYAAGFSPRSYGNDIIYTDNSDLFTTEGKGQRIGYLPKNGKLNRVFINKDNSFEYSDENNMDAASVLNDITRIHSQRLKQVHPSTSMTASKRIKLTN